MLGKRARQQPMRRTTSMRELSSSDSLSSQVDDDSRRSDPAVASQRAAKYGGTAGDWLGALQMAGSYRTRRSSADFVPANSAPFLRACGLCKRSLGPGRDTYMYRGEVAFCSLECRQQQMNIDERINKCVGLSPAAQAASDQSTNGETVAAA